MTHCWPTRGLHLRGCLSIRSGSKLPKLSTDLPAATPRERLFQPNCRCRRHPTSVCLTRELSWEYVERTFTPWVSSITKVIMSLKIARAGRVGGARPKITGSNLPKMAPLETDGIIRCRDRLKLGRRSSDENAPRSRSRCMCLIVILKITNLPVSNVIWGPEFCMHRKIVTA